MVAQTPEINLMDLEHESSKKWLNDLVESITKDRVIDNQLREQMAIKIFLYL